MTERMSGSLIRHVLTIAYVTTVAFTLICGIAAGQYCGPFPGYDAAPVAVSGPCGAIASAGGVTACAGIGGAVASAGGVTAGASALFPVAFAGPLVPYSPYSVPGLLI
jgi:hypothetical protein